LSIFSKKYLNFFIAQFYEDPEKGKEYSEIYDKQMELMRIKNEHPVAKKWDGIEFMRYLYHIFPEAVNLQKDETINIQRVVGTKGENFNNVQMPAVIWNKKIVKTRKIKQDSLIKSTIESLTLNKKKVKKWILINANTNCLQLDIGPLSIK
jgi:hypothetical protein